MSDSFYDTNHAKQTGVLEKSEKQAKTQENLVAAFFRSATDEDFTPDEVQYYVLPDNPLTSVRRAMTNLTKAGILEKTDNLRNGRYGKLTHAWRLRRGEFFEDEKGQLKLFE